MERPSLEGERPVTENLSGHGEFLSNTAHVKRRMNPRRPLRKAKY